KRPRINRVGHGGLPRMYPALRHVKKSAIGLNVASESVAAAAGGLARPAPPVVESVHRRRCISVGAISAGASARGRALERLLTRAAESDARHALQNRRPSTTGSSG